MKLNTAKLNAAKLNTASKLEGFPEGVSHILAVLLGFFIPISTSVSNILLLLLILSWFLSGNLQEKVKLIFQHPVAKYSLALFACFVVACFYTQAAFDEALNLLSKMSKLLYIPFLIPLFIEAKWRKKALLAFVSAMALTLVLGILKVYFDLPIHNRFTPACVFKDHIESNLMMAFASFIVAHFAWSTSEPWKRLGGGLLLLGMIFYVFVMSDGRAGYFIFIALTFIFFLQRFRWRNIIIGVIFLSVCVGGFALTSERFQRRVNLIAYDWEKYQAGQTNSSLGQRLEYLKNTLTLIKVHPWTGWGTGSYRKAYADLVRSQELRETDNPHNEYLNILFNIGILGFLTFLGFLRSLIKSSLQLPALERYLAQGAILSFFVGCFANSWLMDFTPGLFFVLMFAYCFGAYQKNFNPLLHSKTASRPSLISVIVTTYNWPEALARVLKALAGQSDSNFEVIIADDGSKEETRRLINSFKTHFPVSLSHIWQEDQGFRAASIRNKGIKAAQGDYIIFLDGDCIPRTNFVAKHRALSAPGFFVAGNRVLLEESFTTQILSGPLSLQQWSFYKWGLARLQGHCNRVLPFLTMPLGFLRKLFPKRWQGAKGCNLGVWKADLERVNGWEEEFTGWGYEDSDLVLRLIRAGVFRIDARFALPVIHLWHKENDRNREAENWLLLQANKKISQFRAKKGLEYGIP